MNFPGILPAVTTPFDVDDRVDVAALEENVRWLFGAGCSGIVGNGTMGEASSLMRSERKGVLETLVNCKPNDKPLIAGITAEVTGDCIELARDAEEIGADAVMCLPPTAYAADDRELIAHFDSIAGSTKLPLIVYNSPGACKNDMSPAFLLELADQVEGVAAIKETSGDPRRITELVTRSNPARSLEILVGGDDCALEGFAGGATGWISGVAVVTPAACVALHDACVAGNFDTAREIYSRLLPLAQLDMTPKLVQYFKAGVDAVGHRGGPPRLPRLPLDESEQTRLADALAALGAEELAA